MEIEEASGDWDSLAKDARRMLAVNPLVPIPHRNLAHASEKLGKDAEALDSYRALAILDESDPADTHYRLAKLLARLGKPVLVELPTAMFWVQRGYPYDFFARQPQRDVAQYFDLIDRVEVEFSYR